MALKVLIVDDQPAIRQGLRMQIALDPSFIVVGEAGDAGEALLMADTLQPDIVVMDVEMPGMDGILATERLLTLHSSCVVIILSVHDGPAMRARARAAGARAFVSKRDPELLVAALKRAGGSSAPRGGRAW